MLKVDQTAAQATRLLLVPFLSLLSLTATENLPGVDLLGAWVPREWQMPVSLPQARWPDLRQQGVMSGEGWHPPPLTTWRMHLPYMCPCSLNMSLPQGFPSPSPCHFLRNQRLPASECKLKLTLRPESLALCGVLICSDVNNIYLMRKKNGFKTLLS